MKEIDVNATINMITNYYFYDNNKDYGSTYDGLIINTNKGEIKIGIDNSQQCCENWGYELEFTPDNIICDYGSDYYEKKLQYYENQHIDKIIFNSLNDIIVIEIYFNNKSKIIMNIFNEHNGYYAHEYLVEVFGEEIERDFI